MVSNIPYQWPQLITLGRYLKVYFKTVRLLHHVVQQEPTLWWSRDAIVKFKNKN